MKTQQILATVFAGALALSMSACGQDQVSSVADSSATSTTISTITTEAMPASFSSSDALLGSSSGALKPVPKGGSSTVNTDGSVPVPGDPPTPFQLEMYEKLKHDPLPGAPIDMYGYPSTVCIYGDGFALKLVAAGPNTSCEFAVALFDAQTAGLNATYDNVRDHLKHSLNVASPVTGKTYSMNCSNDGNNVVWCTGGNNARIFMY